MKSVKYLTEDEKVRTAFYHLKDGIRLEEGEYLIFRDYGRVKIPWHRIVEIKEFQRWKAYTNNYLKERNPIEDGNQPEMYHEAIEIIERLPEFFPPTDRILWNELEEKIEDESEYIEDENTVESIISLSEYFGMLKTEANENPPTVHLISEDPELPQN